MSDYKKLREKYVSYLKTYRKLNNGSLTGAVTFGEFYMNQIYHSVYNDERIIALMGYN
jgi:hypothetical protein